MTDRFSQVYYEPLSLEYPLGRALKEKYAGIPWIPIESHNRIPELQKAENKDFPLLKRKLILGVRKTHRYVENHKVSDFLVPYTSSGCSAMCLYCYLVCNYNKCAYLRVFVNREQMMEKLIRTANAFPGGQTFEIGSNSDLILENAVTGNLPWTIEEFGKKANGKITFPTKFAQVEPLLPLKHEGKTIFRVSVNPRDIIQKIELGTSPLADRVQAANAMDRAGYPVGLILAPVILVPGWKEMYGGLLEELADTLSENIKSGGFVEIIMMTYSYIHRVINEAAFPKAESLYDPALMTVRGRGKYCYREEERREAEAFLREGLAKRLKSMKIWYVS